ncbi:phenylacetic acid degradation protein PaaN [Streptomyces sp. 3MP-14]|uniref:Phenylacetic acid degradation protein PaaN n=1 Tax=Streptomyces mimosae TaxID=2586635 RepID=A0A5N6A6W1_9ACTN|nr:MULTISPECIES: phenylacetic acid degradation protein PaaN [Streptomyces]KAB8163723.1 phenylacetic acid degradation protein PaaN [Streptomyces mimosae]KAB8175166.1 phenylacetic acid degradation protein PaaN [Streptomyces sp. 3MP-14]
MTPSLTRSLLAERHGPTLEGATRALRERGHFSAFSDNPRDYPREEGAAAFEALTQRRFDLDQPGTDAWVGGEVSPYGIPLGIGYPHPDPEVLLPAMRAALPAWRDAGPEARALVCAEILARLADRTAELAHAVMHTTGQGYAMALQAGGPNALDRGLEAVAAALEAQTAHPAEAEWTRPRGRHEPLRIASTFTPVPRGVALLVGCRTFPTWNGYPGLFASLATGNPVLVKPHPRAVLPLALTVATARRVLAEAGFDPQLVALAAEGENEYSARALAVRDEVRIVDYTGSSAFGDWLEENAGQARVFTEKSGVNTVLVDSTDHYGGLLPNLAFSLSLFSGQMCTTPQNLLIPREGIETDQGHKSFDQVVADLAAAVEALLGDERRAASLLGAVAEPGVLSRLAAAEETGEVALASREFAHPEFPEGRVRTPLLVRLDARQPDAERTLLAEWFGPVAFAVAVDSTAEALALLRRTLRERGALTVLGHTTSKEVEAALVEVCLDERAQLSLNLTGQVHVNQTAAFADYHGTGGNRAGNAALVDGAFVATRFHWAQVRRPA